MSSIYIEPILIAYDLQAIARQLKYGTFWFIVIIVIYSYV
jgi:hypothetical protein